MWVVYHPPGRDKVGDLWNAAAALDCSRLVFHLSTTCQVCVRRQKKEKRACAKASGTPDSEEGGSERLPQPEALQPPPPLPPLPPYVLLLSGALFRCKLRVSTLVAHACGCRRASDPSLWCSCALLRRRLRHRGDGSGWRACTRSATNCGGR